jgi:hypothetical protein
MTDRMDGLGDVELEAALRDLGGVLAGPTPRSPGALDPARLARLRIEREGGAGIGQTRRWAWLAPRPGRRIGRGFAFALAALLVVAAVAGAIGLGLPGIRIVPAPTGSAGASGASGEGSGGGSGFIPALGAPTTTPPIVPSVSPTSSPTIASPLGSNLGLGDPIAIDDMSAALDVPLALPRAAGISAPVTAWLRDGRLTMVWPSSPTLPATLEPGLGLILGEFRGSLEPDYFQKIVGPGTTVSPVTIGDVSGYWISGAPHEIVYVDARGNPVFDSRRSVGDTLIWARGDVTYRLESGLGRTATIALAETIR